MYIAFATKMESPQIILRDIDKEASIDPAPSIDAETLAAYLYKHAETARQRHVALEAKLRAEEAAEVHACSSRGFGCFPQPPRMPVCLPAHPLTAPYSALARLFFCARLSLCVTPTGRRRLLQRQRRCKRSCGSTTAGSRMRLRAAMRIVYLSPCTRSASGAPV